LAMVQQAASDNVELRSAFCRSSLKSDAQKTKHTRAANDREMD
jgi:hypothetical protein